jgi:hypothetical protein
MTLREVIEAGADGVKGTTGAGNGVHGQATTSGGTGVLAENTAGGTALHSTGAANPIR